MKAEEGEAQDLPAAQGAIAKAEALEDDLKYVPLGIADFGILATVQRALTAVQECEEKMTAKLPCSVDVQSDTGFALLRPQVLLEKYAGNQASFSSVLKYLSAALYLKQLAKIAEEKAGSVKANQAYYTLALRDFAEFHDLFSSSPPSFYTDCMAPDAELLGARLRQLVIQFRDGEGSELYDVHIRSGFLVWINVILEFRMTLELASPSMIGKMTAKDFLKKVVVKPAYADLLPQPQFTIEEESGVAVASLEDSKYWTAYGLLQAFFEILRPSKLEVPAGASGLDQPTEQLKKIPTAQATCWLELICVERDMAVSAAWMANFIQDYVGKPLDDERLQYFSKWAVSIQHFSQTTADKLEKLASSAAAKDLEASGANLAGPSVALCGQWGSVMAKLCHANQQSLISLYVAHVTTCSQFLLPPWKSVFADGCFNLQLASSVLSMNEMASVVEFYNKLRRALKELSDAGRRLELSPCVDNHPCTQACFAVGKSRMVDCMDVVCLIQGVKILQEPVSGQTCQEAEAHIAKYGTAHAGLPQLFWQEMNELAKYATAKAPPGKLGGLGATARSSPVKREACESEASDGVYPRTPNKVARTGGSSFSVSAASASTASVATPEPVKEEPQAGVKEEPQAGAPRRGLKRSKA